MYQVGEFSDQFSSGPLYLKLLKSGSITNPRFSNWDLMMKNVYSLGAYNLNQTDFKCDIYYNNIETTLLPNAEVLEETSYEMHKDKWMIWAIVLTAIAILAILYKQ